MPKNYSSLLPALGIQYMAGQGFLSQGNAWFVRPSSADIC
jgi:hypothetical protein